MWSQKFQFCFQLCLNVLWKKSFFLKLISISFTKNESTFKAQLRVSFKNMRPDFQNSFVPTFYYVFCAMLKNETQKSCVILSTSWILQFVIHFWAFLLLCGLLSNILLCFSGIHKYAWKYVIHMVILAFQQKI